MQKKIETTIDLLNKKLQSLNNAKFVGLGSQPPAILINCVNLFDDKFNDKKSNQAKMNSIGKVLPGIAGEAVVEEIGNALFDRLEKYEDRKKETAKPDTDPDDDNEWEDEDASDINKIVEEYECTEQQAKAILYLKRNNYKPEKKEIEQLLTPLIPLIGDFDRNKYKLSTILEMYRTDNGSKLQPDRLLKIYDITLNLQNFPRTEAIDEQVDIAAALLKAEEDGRIQQRDMNAIVTKVMDNKYMITKTIKESVAEAITDIANTIHSKQAKISYAVTAHLLMKYERGFDTTDNALAFLFNLKKYYSKPLKEDDILEKSLELSKILGEIEQKPLSDTTQILGDISKIKNKDEKLDLLARAEIFKLMKAENITVDEAYKRICKQEQQHNEEKAKMGQNLGAAIVGKRALLASSDSDNSDDDDSDDDWP